MRDGIHINKALGEKFAEMRIRVGVLGGVMYPPKKGHTEDGLLVASIAAIHEFGSPRRNIDKRSFILEPIKRELSDIAKKSKNINDIGLKLENVCKEEIETEGHGSWKGFSENYKMRPSGQPVTAESKMLRDTSLLVKSITHKVEGV